MTRRFSMMTANDRRPDSLEQAQDIRLPKGGSLRHDQRVLLYPIAFLALFTSSAPSPEAAHPLPPRIDGGYVGATVSGAATVVRVQDFSPDPLAGFEATLRVGDTVFPWMTIGIEGNMGQSWNSQQRAAHGGLMVELGFIPVPKIPLSIRAGFGFGAGSLYDDRKSGRDGFGGAMFTGSLRYEFFPGATRYRAQRGGGFVIGPELGWNFIAPAAKGRPMSNSFHLGIWTGFYFGS